MASIPQSMQTMVSDFILLGKVVGETVTKVQQMDGAAKLVTELLTDIEQVVNEAEVQEGGQFRATDVEVEENICLGMEEELEVETGGALRETCDEENFVFGERAMIKQAQGSYVQQS